MPALSLRLPEDLDHRLEDEARLERLPRSEVVRIAITDYLARRERERFMAELVAAAVVTQPVNRSSTWWECLAEATQEEWAEWGEAPARHLVNVLEPWPL